MNDNEKNDIPTYLLYNKSIAMLKAINSNYKSDNTEMSDLGVFGILGEAKQCSEVYERVLKYMIDNDLYNKYSKPILEIQLLSPSFGENNSEKDGEEQSKNDNKAQDDNGGGCTTKETNSNKDITMDFIKRMFKDDEE